MIVEGLAERSEVEVAIDPAELLGGFARAGGTHESRGVVGSA